MTDAATLEPPAPVPARHVEVARATQVALPVYLVVPGAAARPVVGPGLDVLAPVELTEAQLVALCPMRRRPVRRGRGRIGLVCAQQCFKRRGRARRQLGHSRGLL